MKKTRRAIFIALLLTFPLWYSCAEIEPQLILLASPVDEIVVSNVSQLTSAMSAATNGTVITLRGGTYAAPVTGWQFANGGVTLRNYPGEQAILSQSRMNVSGNYIIKCLQSSPAVDDNKIIGSDVGTQKGIVMQGVDRAISPAILAYKCDNWEVSGVEFRGVGYGIFTRKVDNGNTSADRWYVHDNFVSDYYRESGMQFNGNGNRIENNVIVKATAQYTSTYGCQVLNLLGNNNVVRNNHLERVNQSVRCIGIFFEWDLADANLIEDNEIVGVVNGMSFFGGDNNIIRNNILTGVDTAFVIRSWADGTTAYPCNFSAFMPLESDVDNPDWQYMYPHDCRSKGNYFEGNTVSGFVTFSAINLPEPSNVFVTSTATATKTPTVTSTRTQTPTQTPPQTPTATRSPAVYYVNNDVEAAQALLMAVTGDTIIFRAGVYNSFTVAKSGLKILAEPGAHIRGGTGIRLIGDDTVFSGFEVSEMTGNYTAGIVSYGDNNVIEKNIVHDSAAPYMAGITISGADNNKVADNITYNNSFFGIGIYNSTGAIVVHNTSYDHILAGGDADGIHCSLSSENTFSGNLVYNNSDDGLDTWDCANNIVSENVSHHNGGQGDGNGFKLGLGGLNIVTGNTSYQNEACGFTSNGAGNYYENNLSYQNGDCGFEDDWRVSGNTQTSQFINNVAWGNPVNFRTGQWTDVFDGNSTAPHITLTPTQTPIPTHTPTAIRTSTAIPTPTALCVPVFDVWVCNGKP